MAGPVGWHGRRPRRVACWTCYTDGLVETRHLPIDMRLGTLLGLLDGPRRPLEETCDRLLDNLRHPDDHDDVALLIVRILPVPDEQASRY